jgi:hypothetical protein
VFHASHPSPAHRFDSLLYIALPCLPWYKTHTSHITLGAGVVVGCPPARPPTRLFHPHHPPQVTQLGHVKDLATAFRLALGNERAYNQIYNISGGWASGLEGALVVSVGDWQAARSA